MKSLEEFLALNDVLQAENTALKTERDTLKAQLSQHVPGPAGGVSVADVAALTAERDTLKAEVVTLKAEVATAKAAQTDFDGKVTMKVAEGLAKHGIRTEGVGTNHKPNGSMADELNKLVKRANERAKSHHPTQP